VKHPVPAPLRAARHHRRARALAGVTMRFLTVTGSAAVLTAALAAAAYAAPGQGVLAAASINQVIHNIQAWLTGILAAVATLFLVVGGVRYLMAGGDPGEVERAKQSLKSAAIGYGLAVLAPVLVQLVGQWVGA
jgi:Type IV secretion system pilin